MMDGKKRDDLVQRGPVRMGICEPSYRAGVELRLVRCDLG